MTTIVIISAGSLSGDLEAFYQATLAYMDAKYHRFPTNFVDFTIGDAQESACKSLQTYAEHLQADYSSDVPVGRQVL